MTLKRKLAFCILIVLCISMTGYFFGSLSNFSSLSVPFLAESGSEELVFNNNEIINTSYFSSAFMPIKLMSAIFALLTIVILGLTYQVYFSFLRKYNVLLLMPIPIWIISTILIYQINPSAPWQISLGLLVACMMAFILLLTDKEKLHQETE